MGDAAVAFTTAEVELIRLALDHYVEGNRSAERLAAEVDAKLPDPADDSVAYRGWPVAEDP